jgi:DNA-binding FrmR family transcriptional regulator
MDCCEDKKRTGMTGGLSEDGEAADIAAAEIAAEKSADVCCEEEGSHSCCSARRKERDAEEVRCLMNRLKRIEGQIRGIEGMVEKDAYCPDILIQVSAVNSALNSFNKALLAQHIRTCVADDIREGKDETIDELVGVIQKIMK